jgi:hypothetical protein
LPGEIRCNTARLHVGAFRAIMIASAVLAALGAVAALALIDPRREPRR